MELNEYQSKAMDFCNSAAMNPLYAMLEISEECGELEGKFAKAIRASKIRFNENQLNFDAMTEEERLSFKDGVKKEIGDILWGISALSYVLGWELEEVARENISKLVARSINGTIIGSGDGVTKEERK